MNVPLDTIRKVIKEFKCWWSTGLNLFWSACGVKYYNDSKGTNPDAAIQAIRAMPGPTVLIAGGYDKQERV